MILSGTILEGQDLTPVRGHISIGSGKIEEISAEGSVRDRHIILPGFVNCHTHIGDYIFKDRGLGLPLGELVGSPDGLKHRLLRGAAEGQLETGMAAAVSEMICSGITTFMDFREQGLAGIRVFRRAIDRIRGLPLGRPGEGTPGEVEAIADQAHGFGLDRLDAYAREILGAVARFADRKIVSVHVSEGRWRDGEIDDALDLLRANTLIHVTHANRREIRRMAREGIGAVVCPRCNLHLGVGKPPIDTLMEEGVVTGLGTDNAMINSPNMFREMETALAVMRRKSAREVLSMATVWGARVAGISGETGSLEAGKDADLLVLTPGPGMEFSDDVHAAVVKRAGPGNVSLVMRGGEIILDRRRED